MVKHEMKLNKEPFESIQAGTKTIELRLNDEKRQLLNVGDVIEFTNIETKEKQSVEVDNLFYYDSFEELYKHFDKVSLGYDANEVANYKDMEQYYPQEEQKKYGVVGIKIKKI